MGATWLGQRLVNGDAAIANAGFGTTVKEALRKRVDFLIEHGFAQRDGDCHKAPSNLLTVLRQHDLESVGLALAAETGMSYRPPVDGERATGIYRRMIVSASGRFAVLDDGLGFSLVPSSEAITCRGNLRGTAYCEGPEIVASRNVSRRPLTELSVSDNNCQSS